MTLETSWLALVAATWLHAGFQLVVTTLVYPAFFHVSEQDWPAFHDRHSRRILGVVLLVYGSVTASAVWVLAQGEPDFALNISLVAGAVAILVTAGVAAPAHRRLASRRDFRELSLLLAWDKVRCAAAAVAALSALWGALGI